jgi:hypothetical protein
MSSSPIWGYGPRQRYGYFHLAIRKVPTLVQSATEWALAISKVRDPEPFCSFVFVFVFVFVLFVLVCFGLFS